MLMALRAYRYYRESRWEVWGNGIHATSSRAKPSIFLAHRYSVLCVIRKMGMLLRRKQESAECEEDFSLRSKWLYGGMGLFHVAYNEYVWKALFLYRHPERSRGIFLAEGDNVVCVIAEKGKPFAKGARKSRVQGRFLAALEMTAWGMDIRCIV